MLELNLTAYGIGLGLVIAPWIGGIIVSYAFSLANISKII
jgi:hypothetical protein